MSVIILGYTSRGESEKGLIVYICKEALRPFSLSILDLDKMEMKETFIQSYQLRLQ